MEQKHKPTVYVKGNIIAINKLAVRGGGKLESFLPEDGLDLSESIVIEGDVTLDSLIVHNGFVAASGEIQKGVRYGT